MKLNWLVGLTTGLLLFFNLDFMTVSFITRTSTREDGLLGRPCCSCTRLKCSGCSRDVSESVCSTSWRGLLQSAVKTHEALD